MSIKIIDAISFSVRGFSVLDSFLFLVDELLASRLEGNSVGNRLFVDLETR